jgi:hypothetical protein
MAHAISFGVLGGLAASPGLARAEVLAAEE